MTFMLDTHVHLDGLTADNATPDNVNVIVLKIKVLIEAATTACGSASGVGSGNILVLISITLNVCYHSLAFDAALNIFNSLSSLPAITATVSARIRLTCSSFFSFSSTPIISSNVYPFLNPLIVSSLPHF